MTPILRLPLLTSAILATSIVGIVPQARAQNYPWCAEYSMGQGGTRNCGFVSFAQCMTTVQGMGGFCAENNTYVAPIGPHPKMKARTRS
ncbi:MAG TPA: DUF3551 domain-containing protein [Xanthobacteraceae bacterium]|jgi:hypothetical protein|nr:DUF3551 domain-containing protein [Xanthobacteraceae bacterium]